MDKFVLRLPDGMRQRISDAAKSNNRTMTAEIVARLEQTFSQEGEGPSRSEKAFARLLTLGLPTEALERRLSKLEQEFESFKSGGK